MIFLCGIPSEPSLGLVIQELDKLGTPHVVFHQRRFADMEIELEVASGLVHGRMRLEGSDYPLEKFTGVYTRLMDYRFLPEFENLPPESAERSHCQNLHATLTQWYEIAPCKVLNRRHEIGANYSKPLQAQLIRACGFAVPETLVTNDPAVVRAFRKRHGRVIYKSASYVRSIVSMLTEEDMGRLVSLCACPVQFQEYIDGVNVRVHTVGEEVFPTTISASSVDYRYAYLEGEHETLQPVELSAELSLRCLELAAAFGLEFAGIDLKVTDNGDVYCLEVNPAPAFSYYELHTGQSIARSVAEYLTSESRPGRSEQMVPRYPRGTVARPAVESAAQHRSSR